MKRPELLRTRALALFLFFPLATVPIIYGAKEFETIASWYGPGFQGRRTANGERFDQNAMTAASKTLPFGTRVVVYNPRNDRRCVVTINDRGPYIPGRGIDLSHAAASKLGISGIAPVVCFAGGTSYTDIAQKEKHHKHNLEHEAPLAIPAPESNDTNTIASKPEMMEGNAAVAGGKKDLVTIIPPRNSETASPGELDSANNIKTANVEKLGATTSPALPKTEQMAVQNSEPLTREAAQPGNLPSRLVQSSKLAELPKTQTLPVTAKTISTTTESTPERANEQYAVPAVRKPGELLAAALATPGVYHTPNLTARLIAITPEQTVPRASLLPRGGYIVAPTAPTITSVLAQPTRGVSRASTRTYVVHRKLAHYSRHAHRRTGRSDDLIDRVASKIGSVCKKVLASL
jgi:rare lipoprotein A (peptidoglycan hydrolase)